MNRPEIFARNIKILAEAFDAGIIHPRYACSCVVAHLIISTNNYSFTPHSDGTLDWKNKDNQYVYVPGWYYAVMQYRSIPISTITTETIRQGKKELAATGYTMEEIASIDKATKGYEYGFQAVQNAVDTICTIHKCTDEERAEAMLIFYVELQE